jgi:hypothetical protein
MMDGAGCDLFLWFGFVGKVWAHLPRRLVDHGLRIALINSNRLKGSMPIA